MTANCKEVLQFSPTVRSHYRKHGRDLPWRKTSNPYRILVSEVMLQQTQVERVIPKYKAFLKAFPTSRSLARAKLRDVLSIWSGLGYNRRAKALHDAANVIVGKHNRKIPDSREELEELPGIGPYTAGAVLAFAYNKPEVFIETNIRTVFIHHFFKNKKKITDEEIVRCIELTVDRKNPREWYFALMDYGAMLKQKYPNPNRRSVHYTKQSKFEGSNRQLRGEIIRLLVDEKQITKQSLVSKLPKDRKIVEEILSNLIQEKLIVRNQKVFSLS